MGIGNVALKRELVAAKKLAEEGELIRFQEDVLFGTPSQAGSIVSGIACNGRVAWKRLRDGRSLNDIDSEESGDTATRSRGDETDLPARSDLVRAAAGEPGGAQAAHERGDALGQLVEHRAVVRSTVGSPRSRRAAPC